MLTIINTMLTLHPTYLKNMDISKYWKTVVDTLRDGLLVVDPKGQYPGGESFGGKVDRIFL
jgi:hypothetical protein